MKSARFSNTGGSVQFIVVQDTGAHDCHAGEQQWLGQRLVGEGAGTPNVYVFPNDLPTCHTSGRRILIAT